MTEDDPHDELEDTLRRLLPDLVDRPGALLTEWTLVVGYTDADDGANAIEVVTGPTGLLSHSLGALRFAELVLEDRIRDTP